MMVPITLVVALLRWAGFIDMLAEMLAPVLKYIGLSAEGVLVFITSCLTSLYSAIALIATLDIDFRMATILAVMGLVCHNLIVETVIQRKAGANALYMVLLRISGAIIVAISLNSILPADYSGKLILEYGGEVHTELLPTLKEWGMSMIYILPVMFMLIVVLNMLQSTLKEFRILDYLTLPFKPLMTLFGLSRDSSFLWLVMNTIGLAYGGSILISEYESGEISRRDSQLLNTHVAMSHSLLEDSLIFIAIGISPIWIFVPRIILSLIAVWSEKLIHGLNKKVVYIR